MNTQAMETRRHNAEIAAGFLAWCRQNKGLQESTCEQYAQDIEALTAWMSQVESGRTMRLEWLNADIIETWAKQMMAQRHSANTVNRRMSTMSQLGAWLKKTKRTEQNPMDGMTRPKRAKTLPKPADGALVGAYLRREASSTQDRQLQALVALMMQTGVRISEALGLEFADIDKQEHALTIRGKGAKERRVYYTRETAEKLNLWAQERSERRGRVFTMSYWDAYSQLRDKLRTGDRGITPHQLRHAFATRQLEKGTDMMTLANMMGHEDIATTRRYIRVSDNRQRQAFTA